jgi:hypothetical protein
VEDWGLVRLLLLKDIHDTAMSPMVARTMIIIPAPDDFADPADEELLVPTRL